MHALNINRKKVVLYYLLRFGKFHDGEEIATSIDSTAHGIARNLGLNPNQVSTLLKSLLTEGLVERRKMHIYGERQRKYVYRLTDKGVESAKEFEELIAKKRFWYVCNGIEGWATIPEIALQHETDLLRVLVCAKEDRIEIERIEKTGLEISDTKIYGRARELAILSKFENSNAKVCFVYGIEGIGKTTLLSHALAFYKTPKFFFVVKEEYGLDIFLKNLWNFLVDKIKAKRRDAEGLKEGILEAAKRYSFILAIDDFQQARKELRDFVIELLRIAVGFEKGMKLILSSSSRLNFEPKILASGRVIEIELEPLPYIEALKMLSQRGFCEEEARRVYEASQGIPAYLEIATPDKPIQGMREQILAMLSDEERELVEAGALFEHPFEAEALFYVLGRIERIDYDLLQSLHERFILKRDFAGRYVVQPFIAKAILESMKAEKKENLHLSIGKYYEVVKRDVLLSLLHFISSKNLEEIEKFIFRNRYLLLNSGNLGLVETYLSKLLDELRARGLVSKKILFFYAQVLEALGLWMRAEAIYERLSDESYACLSYALMLLRSGSIDEKTRKVVKKARKLCKESLALEAEEFYIEGYFAEQEDRLEEAIRNYRKAIEICKKIHLPIVEIYAWVGLARISVFSKRFEEAKSFLSKAEALMLIASGSIERSLFNLAIGGVHLASGELEKAREAYGEALKYASDVGERRLLLAAVLGLSACFIGKGEIEEAKKYFLKAEELRNEINDWQMLATFYAQKLCFAQKEEVEKIIEQLHLLLSKHSNCSFARGIGRWAIEVLKWKFKDLPSNAKLLLSIEK